MSCPQDVCSLEEEMNQFTISCGIRKVQRGQGKVQRQNLAGGPGWSGALISHKKTLPDLSESLR